MLSSSTMESPSTSKLNNPVENNGNNNAATAAAAAASATVIQSRRPRPAATASCKECGVKMEYSLPGGSSKVYHVACFSCCHVNAICDADIHLIHDGTFRREEKTTTTGGAAAPPPPLPNRNSTTTSSSSSKSKPSSSSSAPSFAGFGSGKTGSDANPLDLEYYELLNVKPNATTAQIKKAYYVMAMKYHPDKNKDDPNAEEVFKKISEAYQTLFDPQRRAYYNQYGKANQGQQAAFVDPEEFFKQQFGGDKFVDLIGEISIAKDFKEAMSMMSSKNGEGAGEGESSSSTTNTSSSGGNDSTLQQTAHLTPEERMQVRSERVSKLATSLIEKISFYTDAFPTTTTPAAITDHNNTSSSSIPTTATSSDNNPVGATMQHLAQEALVSFKGVATVEAESLKTENYGVELLHAIGFTYDLKARQYIGVLDVEEGDLLKKIWGWGNRVSGSVKEKAHIFNETVGTFRTALDLQTKFAKLQEMEKKKTEASEKAAGGDKGGAGGGATDTSVDEAEDRELRQRLESEAANKGLEALWRGSKLEVESVLREVCDRVLDDKMVPKEIRRRRAEALQVLGQVYMNVKSDDDVNNNNNKNPSSSKK